MSSFKRRLPSQSVPGTRPSPYTSLPLLSTGLASLDDLLGGGLPLSSSLLIAADHPTSYALLLLKFWIAQGLVSQQEVIVVGSGISEGNSPESIVTSLMELDGAEGGTEAENEELANLTAATTGQISPLSTTTSSANQNEKLKIAFRYEGMKQHAVSLPEPSPPKAGEVDVYCSTFDLAKVKQLRANDRARLQLIDVDQLTAEENSSGCEPDVYCRLYDRLERVITEGGYRHSDDPAKKPRKALRIALADFGSPSWGPATNSSLYSFLHRLRPLLRNSSASLVFTFPTDFYSGQSSNLLTRLSHAVDSTVHLNSFANSPISLSIFPRHHGLLTIPKLPSIGSLVPPSAKLSVLKGLGGGGEGRENNLGFRVKRRRFVVETVGGDEPVDWGTKPPPQTTTTPSKPASTSESAVQPKESTASEPRVKFADEPETKPKTESGRKSVSAIIHKQPELFEF